MALKPGVLMGVALKGFTAWFGNISLRHGSDSKYLADTIGMNTLAIDSLPKKFEYQSWPASFLLAIVAGDAEKKKSALFSALATNHTHTHHSLLPSADSLA